MTELYGKKGKCWQEEFENLNSRRYISRPTQNWLPLVADWLITDQNLLPDDSQQTKF